MNYSFFFKLRIYFLPLYLLKLFEHSKYMIIYKIGDLRNFNSFPNCKTLKILHLLKLKNFRNLMIYETVKFGKFFEISEVIIFGIFKI